MLGAKVKFTLCLKISKQMKRELKSRPVHTAEKNPLFRQFTTKTIACWSNQWSYFVTLDTVTVFPTLIQSLACNKDQFSFKPFWVFSLAELIH